MFEKRRKSIGISLILLGILCIGLAMLMGGCKVLKLRRGLLYVGSFAEEEWDDKRYTSQAIPKTIKIEDPRALLTVEPYSGKQVLLGYQERADAKLKIKEEGERLIIKRDVPWEQQLLSQTWYRRGKEGIPTLRLLLPRAFTGRLDIQVVDGTLSFDMLELEAIKVQSVNALIQGDKLRLENFKAETVNAKLQLKDVKVKEDIHLETVNGRIDFEALAFGKRCEIEAVHAKIHGQFKGRAEDYQLHDTLGLGVKKQLPSIGEGSRQIHITAVGGSVTLAFTGDASDD